MSEQPLFKANHDPEDIDASGLAVHHTLGTFRYNAAGGAHRHTVDDPMSLPLFSELTLDAGNPVEVWNLFELLGATIENKPDSTWQSFNYLDNWSDYGGTWAPAKYRKLSGNLVNMFGLIERPGTLTTGGSVFANIPAAYRPAKNIMFGCYGKVSGELTFRVDIETNGNCRVRASGTSYTNVEWVSISNITYVAAG